MKLGFLLPSVLILSALSWASDDEDSPTVEKTQRVTLRSGLDSISRRGDINVIVPDSIAGKEIRAELSDSGEEWLEDLERIADELHADLWPLGKKTYALLACPPITMAFTDADLSVVLDLVSRNTGINLMTGSEVRGLVSLNVRDASVRRVLESVAYATKLIVVRERDGIYRISTREQEQRLAEKPLPAETLAALGLGRSRAPKERVVSLEVSETLASDLVRMVSEATGLRMGIDPNLDKPVTLKLRDCPWKDVLEAIAWKTEGVVWDEGRGSVKIRDVPCITMEFVDADIKVVLDLIARNARVNMLINSGVQGSGGSNVRNAPWRDVVYSLSRKVPFHLLEHGGVFMVQPFYE